ncbi:MAG: hypothetical protein KC502_07745 [Myxococcales bacterium]|nr:hypothetical protein [Myxococcales bacterium]
MKTLVAKAFRPAKRLSLIVAVALALMASGCVVQSNGGANGVLDVNWSAADCNALGASTVRIRAMRDGVQQTEVNNIECNRGVHSVFLPPGTYTIGIDALSPNGQKVGGGTTSNISVFMNQTTATETIPLVQGGGGVGTGNGELQVHWTIGSEAAVTGCAKVGLATVTVSLLGVSGSKVLSTASTACKDGGINMTGVAPGTYRVQLDGATAGGVLTWGNAQPTAPIVVAPGMSVIVKEPIAMVDLRATISLDWQFSDSKSCFDKNTQSVLIEIRDGNNKVVVPMTDAFAKKPCAISSNSEYSQRVIDLQFATPTCTIPAGAKGLVLCGITSKVIGVSVSTIDNSDGQIYFGGSMKIESIPAAKHTAITTPLFLSACNQSSNICAAP